MSEKILKSEEMVITFEEYPNFDRACTAAYQRALRIMKIDDCGHSPVKGYERSNSCIRVVFERYEHIGGMGGQSYNYYFRAEAVRG